MLLASGRRTKRRGGTLACVFLLVMHVSEAKAGRIGGVMITLDVET